MPVSACAPVRGRSIASRIFVGAGAALLAATAAIGQPLNGEVRGILERAKLGTARVGVSVIDAESGTVIAQVRSGTGGTEATFSPASNMKLLTTGTALLVLGKDFEFRTKFYKSGTRLVIEGAGDPGFADPELLAKMHQPLGEFVDRLAASIKDGAAGSGFTEVVVDDRVFDRDATRDTWPQDQMLNWYCAEVSGLNFHTNVLRLFAAPAEQEGMAPKIRWEPAAPGIDVQNHARTARKADTTTIGFAREGAGNTILVKGSLKAALSSPETVTLRNSGLVLARMLADRLRDAGLSATGSAPPCRVVGEDETLGVPEKVYVIVRTSMETILDRCNKDSHNLYAECLLKRVGYAVTGQPGSWANGGAVVRMQVRERVGAEAAAALVVIDGSGLSRGNAVTPEILTGWLAALSRDENVADTFIASLPVAGQDGTMAKRFRDKKLVNEVRGKSGLIDGVRCLTGYVSTKDGSRRLAYSILVNDMPPNVPGPKVKEFHEDVVAAVDKWLAGHSARAKAEAIGG